MELQNSFYYPKSQYSRGFERFKEGWFLSFIHTLSTFHKVLMHRYWLLSIRFRRPPVYSFGRFFSRNGCCGYPQNKQYIHIIHNKLCINRSQKLKTQENFRVFMISEKGVCFPTIAVDKPVVKAVFCGKSHLPVEVKLNLFFWPDPVREFRL